MAEYVFSIESGLIVEGIDDIEEEKKEEKLMEWYPFMCLTIGEGYEGRTEEIANYCWIQPGAREKFEQKDKGWIYEYLEDKKNKLDLKKIHWKFASYLNFDTFFYLIHFYTRYMPIARMDEFVDISEKYQPFLK